MAGQRKVVMNHSLAKALMEAGVEHMDLGGMVGGLVSGGLSLLPNLVKGVANDMTVQNGYQAGLAPTQSSNYGDTISGASKNSLGGYGQAQNIQGQQQSLADQLLAQSKGAGPNPAQAALNQNTGNNIAAQAALMAGQRGASANPGVLARQAALQGAGIQQNAVGQAATLDAEQRLAAERALQQQQAEMGGQNIQEQGVNNALFGTAAGAQNAQNNTAVNNYGMMQGINSGVAQSNANSVNKTTGGFINGAGGILAATASKGGRVEEGKVSPPTGTNPNWPEHLHKMASIYHPKEMTGAMNFKSGGPVPGKAEVRGNSPKNDTQLALLSPGEEVLPRSVTQAKNAPQKAAEFVKHLQSKGGKEDPQKGYEKVAAGKKDLEARVARLEKLLKGAKK